MIPTNHEEALSHLLRTCAEAAVAFAACADGAQAPPLRDALWLRSEQCRSAGAKLASACRSAADVDASAAPRRTVGGGDARAFSEYESVEGQVLSAFRDALDQELPEAIAAPVTVHFEIALKQYMALALLRPSATATATRSPVAQDDEHETLAA